MLNQEPPAPAQLHIQDLALDEAILLVADQLEEEIVLGALHPRERLVEDDLCSRFTLKRHAVRQVLVELERRGLVERRRNQGALIRSYSVQEVIDLYALREILESAAARRITLPVEPSRLAELMALQSEHDQGVLDGDMRAVFRANVRFHRAFFALSDNAALTEAIFEYQRRTHAIRASSSLFPHFLERVRREHHALIAALTACDRDSLVTLTYSHLQPAREAYLATYHRRAESRQSPAAQSSPQQRSGSTG